MESLELGKGIGGGGEEEEGEGREGEGAEEVSIKASQCVEPL